MPYYILFTYLLSHGTNSLLALKLAFANSLPVEWRSSSRTCDFLFLGASFPLILTRAVSMFSIYLVFERPCPKSPTHIYPLCPAPGWFPSGHGFSPAHRSREVLNIYMVLIFCIILRFSIPHTSIFLSVISWHVDNWIFYISSTIDFLHVNYNILPLSHVYMLFTIYSLCPISTMYLADGVSIRVNSVYTCNLWASNLLIYM